VDELKALVLDEVGVVLDVERGEWQLADEAAGGNPGIVGRSRAAAGLAVGLDSSQLVATYWSLGRTTSPWIACRPRRCCSGLWISRASRYSMPSAM
jgi:hypothetical protein